MTVEIFNSFWNSDGTVPLSFFILLGVRQKRKCSNWINLCPRLIKFFASKGSKTDLRSYPFQEIKVQNFMKLHV